jgi:PPM family protein phosphatase
MATGASERYKRRPMPFRIYSWGSTDVGMRRDHNEDSYLLAPDLNLYVVADGMGGHAGGEMASGISVRTIERHVRQRLAAIDAQPKFTGPTEKSPLVKLISDAVRDACSTVHQKSHQMRELQGMGTTTTALLFHDRNAYVGHVGDSRCYLVREGRVLQVTEDHSLVNEQLRAGLITEAQARSSRFKNIITRSVGFEHDVDVDVVCVEAHVGDSWLVCCDGLSNFVTDLEIQDVVDDNFLHRVPDVLIDIANSRGGDDNITVVLAHVAEEDEVSWGDDEAPLSV